MSSTDTDLYTDEDELSIVDFDFGDDPPLNDDKNVGAIKESNPYIKSILQSSGLHLLEEAKAIKAYETQNVIGLFYLFIARSYLRDCIYKWTKDVLKEKWNATDFRFCDLKQYIGLEIVMSFNSFHTISDYW